MPGGAAGILDRQSQGLANVAAAVRADPEVAATAGPQLSRLETITIAAQDAAKASAALGLTDVAANWKAL